MSERRRLVIVGGGPAGMAAAIEAARCGLKSVILDEAARLGGQIYRQIPAAFSLADPAHGRKDFARGDRLRAELQALSEMVELRHSTSVIGVWNGRSVQWADGARSGLIEAEQLVLAPGAYDRPVPFPGWTLPGVMTAGGAQSFMKAFGVRPGERAVVTGTGPLLMVVAGQLNKAGVNGVALLEAGRPRGSMAAALAALAHPALLADAAGYLWALRRAGIQTRYGHTVLAAEGDGEVERVTFAPIDEVDWKPRREGAITVDADLLVVGFGFVPSSELAELAGCTMEYQHAVGGWVPARDEAMRTSVAGVMSAGDGAGVGGVLVAVEEGRVAGISAAQGAGVIGKDEADRRRAPHLRRLRSLSGIRRVLDALSLIRPGLNQLANAQTLMCRCEEVSRAQVDAAIADGARDLPSVKLGCRLGMGACQGRNCAPSAALYLSERLGRPIEAMGRINPRPPIKPVSLGALANLSDNESA